MSKDFDTAVKTSIRYIGKFAKKVDRTFKSENVVEFDKQLNTLVGEISIFSNIIKEFVFETNWKQQGSYTALLGRLTIISMLNGYPIREKGINKELVQLELCGLFTLISYVQKQDELKGIIDSIKQITYHLMVIKQYLRFEGNHEKS